jgi:hypothetical protein
MEKLTFTQKRESAVSLLRRRRRCLDDGGVGSAVMRMTAAAGGGRRVAEDCNQKRREARPMEILCIPAQVDDIYIEHRSISFVP